MSCTQIVNTKEEEVPLTSYSIDDLNQLNNLLTQSLNHYNSLFKDEKLMATLKDGDIFALKLCLKETEAEMKLVSDEITSRSDKK
jgi:hypothetical protein